MGQFIATDSITIPTDVGPVQEGQQEEHKEWGEDVQIELPQQLLLYGGVDVCPRRVVDGLDLLVWEARGFLLVFHGEV